MVERAFRPNRKSMTATVMWNHKRIKLWNCYDWAPHGSYGGCISWIMNPSATYRSKLYCIVNINVEVCTPHRTHNIRMMQSAKIENNKNKKKHTHLWQGKEHISHNMKSTHIPKIIIFFYFIATMVDFFYLVTEELIKVKQIWMTSMLSLKTHPSMEWHFNWISGFF